MCRQFNVQVQGILKTLQWRIQNLPEWASDPKRWGANRQSIILANFPPKLHENKENKMAEKGTRIPSAPLG